jgi:hypothetical protein
MIRRTYPRATLDRPFYVSSAGIKVLLVPALHLDPPRADKILAFMNCARRFASCWEWEKGKDENLFLSGKNSRKAA